MGRMTIYKQKHRYIRLVLKGNLYVSFEDVELILDTKVATRSFSTLSRFSLSKTFSLPFGNVGVCLGATVAARGVPTRGVGFNNLHIECDFLWDTGNLCFMKIDFSHFKWYR